MKCLLNIRFSRSLLAEIAAFYVFLVVFFAASYLLHTRMQNDLLSTAPYLDMVGRQRMLTQRIAFLALKVQSGSDADRPELKSALAQFDVALASLQGKDFAKKSVSGPLGEALEKEALAWKRYKASVLALASPTRPPVPAAGAASLEAGSSEMLLLCENAALQLRLLTEAKLKSSRSAMSYFLLLSLGITLLAIYRVQKGLVAPIRAIADLTAEITAGKFPEIHIPAPSNELGDMIRNFSTMRDSMNSNLQIKTAINSLLSLSLERLPLDTLLDRLLENMLSTPWPGLAAKGAIFLADPETGALHMKAQRGLPPPLLEKCAMVPSGHCLCGRAAATKQVVFADGLDERHETKYPHMPPHGHYCVPIVSEKKTLGAFTIYTGQGHKEDKDAVFFLQSMAGILSGIIQRRLAEDEKALLSDVLEQAFDAVIITGTDGKIKYVNRSFERITGFTRAESLGKTPNILKSDEKPRDTARSLWSAITGGKVWSQRVTNKRKDGSPLKMDCVIFPVKGENGDIRAFASVQRDITEQSILETQLLQAQKLETLGRLAGGVAHDFNNVLGAILGYADMLLRGNYGGTELAADLEEIKKAAQRGAGITRQLLTFSRKSRPEMKVLTLNPLILNMQKMLSRLTGENIEFQLDLLRDLPHVYADQVQIEQIVMNLVVNARDAMPGSGKITITTSVAAAPDLPPTIPAGEMVVLSVRDTGGGMDEAVLSKIFDPFFTTKGEGKGTGLGLSVVYSIAKQHGGGVTVSSSPGKGSMFRIYLPARPAGDIAASAPALAAPPAKGRGERIWLVEDDEQLRNHISRLLLEYGYRPSVFSRAEEALAANSSGEPAPDLLITDVTLPGLNGYELAEKLSWKNSGRVLYITGYSEPVIPGHAGKPGETVLLRKPFENDTLLLAIGKIFNNS
ncbi:MAG: PAS domain S-box protein [Elusimicrobia bacterium]|nr:PAS domain S-box protein [Elusimicrobiota bacterium]